MLDVQNGDLSRLGVLFERYHGRLFNFYLRLTASREISEDLVQDVFFRILKYRRTYRGNSQFSTWMFGIARNAQIDYFRKRRREVTLEDEMEETLHQGPLHGRRLEADQQAALLRDALLKLPEEKREVLVLSRFQDLKYRQIAEILGCDIGTVKTRVFRAMRDLRELYFEMAGEKAS
jgi:RNA polymerase sigma-70 factor (ECF subfamily)